MIGADGGKSTIRRFVIDKTPTYAGYTLWRGLCPTALVQGPPHASKTVNGVHYETLGFPVRKSDGDSFWNCGVYMAMPESMVEQPVKNRQVGHAALKEVPSWFNDFVAVAFDDYSAQFWAGYSIHGRVSPHAVWEFSADRVVNGRIILLGDAAHMASPRTGAGAYTAMVDSVVLGQAFEQASSIKEALSMYNTDTVARGKELYARSRNAASYFTPENVTIRPPSEVTKDLVAMIAKRKQEGGDL